MRDFTVSSIEKEKVIAILRGVENDKLLPVAKALYDGGIRLIEVTFRQQAPDSAAETARAIEWIRSEYEGRMLVGAGTVLTEAQADLAHRAGAGFIISPDTEPHVIARTRELDMVSIPGAMTSTEILAAHRAGADFVKIFPASVMGTAYIKAIRGPISHVRLLAVGGIDSGNAAAFLKAGVCGVGVGGKLVDAGAIEKGDFEKLTKEATALVGAVNQKEG